MIDAAFTISILGITIPAILASLLEVIVFAIPCAIAGYEDMKYRDIAGELCLLIVGLMGLDALLFKNIATFIAFVITFTFIYILPEVSGFGSADIFLITIPVMICSKAWMLNGGYFTVCILLMIASMVWIFVSKIIRKEKGNTLAALPIVALTLYGTLLWLICEGMSAHI